MTLSRPEVQRLLAEHGIKPSKALGQNFVADPNTVRRIAHLAGVSEGTNVVEVGAGLGSLTLALVEAGASVVAIELDRRLVPILQEVVRSPMVRIVQGDAMTIDWDEVLGNSGATSWSLVSNLPYSVATPLVVRVLEEVPQVGSLTVLVQREVGERMAAGVGDPAYGAVSVKVAYWATAKLVARVPAAVFVPRPRVESVLVRMVRREFPAVDPARVSYDRFEKVLKAGFAHRRKMLRRCLAGIAGPDSFELAGVRPESRAEELNVEQWGLLAEQSNE